MLVSLKENSAFRRLYHRGKTAGSRYLVIYCSRNRLGFNRYGMTVSTKLGHAVVRNRMRRRFREIFRLAQPKMKQGYDVIIVGRGRAVRAEYREMEAAFEKVCRKLGLWEEQA